MDFLVYILIGVIVLVVLYLIFPVSRIRKQNRLLRQQAEEIDYQNSVLEQHNIRLKELNHEKRQIMSVVTHDLKSPLNRVFALTNLVSMGADNLTPDQLDYLKRIDIVVLEGQSLVRNLLDVRAIEDHGIQLKVEHVKLDSLLAALKKTFAATVQRKKIDLVVHPSKIEIQSDRQYLQRIFEILVSNAIKYTSWESQVLVSAREEGHFVSFDVEDEGPGIQPEEADRLCNPFEVLSSKPSDGETATGIGLFVAKSLLTQLGGELIYENKDKKGVVFSAKIPINPTD